MGHLKIHHYGSCKHSVNLGMGGKISSSFIDSLPISIFLCISNIVNNNILNIMIKFRDIRHTTGPYSLIQCFLVSKCISNILLFLKYFTNLQHFQVIINLFESLKWYHVCFLAPVFGSNFHILHRELAVKCSKSFLKLEIKP